MAIAALATMALLSGACGSDSADDSRSQSATTAAPSKASRIVSLSPTATEMLFAVGAGKQVVAVDDQSNFPPEAPKTDLSGFKPNVEAIATYKPDLVVISDASGDLEASLKKVNIDVLAQPAASTLDDTYRQLEELGDVTGHRAKADEVVKDLKQKVASISEGAKADAAGATYYHELDPTYFTATSKTFIGSVYALFGLKNIADEADAQGSGYPQLSAEYIVKASPDFIFLADTKCCQESAETVAKRSGWSQIAAVRNGRVVALDDDLASRWGPRIVDYMTSVAAALKASKKTP